MGYSYNLEEGAFWQSFVGANYCWFSLYLLQIRIWGSPNWMTFRRRAMTMIMTGLHGVSRTGLQSTNFVQTPSSSLPPPLLSKCGGGAFHDMRMMMGIIMGIMGNILQGYWKGSLSSLCFFIPISLMSVQAQTIWKGLTPTCWYSVPSSKSLMMKRHSSSLNNDVSTPKVTAESENQLNCISLAIWGVPLGCDSLW